MPGTRANSSPGLYINDGVARDLPETPQKSAAVGLHQNFKTKSVVFPALNSPNYPLKSYRAEAFYESLLVCGGLPAATSFTDHRVCQYNLRIYFQVSKAVNRLTT